LLGEEGRGELGDIFKIEGEGSIKETLSGEEGRAEIRRRCQERSLP